MRNLIKKNQLMITALAIMIAIAGYLEFAGTGLEEEYLTVSDEAAGDVVDVNGEVIENYTAEELAEIAELDSMLELTDIESLDSDVNMVVDDYLDEGMQVSSTDEGLQAQVSEIATDVTVDSQIADAGENLQAEVTPEEGEIPGEAVFTSTNGVAVLADAKLLKEQTRAKNKETLMEIIGSDGLTDVQKQEAVDGMVKMTEIAEKESAAEILLEAKGFSDVVVSMNGDAVDVVVNAIELSDAQRAQIEDIVTRKTSVPAENIIISTVVE